MSDNKENCNPLPSKQKKNQLSLSLSKRFKDTTEEELQNLSTKKTAKNTEASTKWAIKNLTDWFHEHNAAVSEKEKCPEEILLPNCSPEVLNKWLCVYVNETRSHTGTPYPPATLHALLAGVCRFMKDQNSFYPNFMDRSNPKFVKFNTTLDNLYKKLRQNGVGASSKHTESISKGDENQLWSSGVLNVTSASGLLKAVFFYNGKCFCLRGGAEHRNLKITQFVRKSNPDRYIYTENASKNRQGGLRELRLQHKSVPIIADPDAGIKCHVYLLDLYISKLPSGAIENDIFYCRPLQVYKKDDVTWYTSVPVGRNKLSEMVSEMCQEAGVVGRKSNHSLRVAGATALFDAGVPERIIQERTGHKSIEALRVYERVTEKQEAVVSKVLSGSVDNFNDPINMEKSTDHKSLIKSDKSVCEDIKPVLPLATPGPSYYNCTVNMFQSPNPQFPQPYYYPNWPTPLSFDFPGLSVPQNWQVSGDLPEEEKK